MPKPPWFHEVMSGLILLAMFGGFIWFWRTATRQGELCAQKYPGSHLAGPLIHPRCEMSQDVGHP